MKFSETGKIARFSLKDIDRYAEISEDLNPLHMDHNYAQLNDQPGRVVHGAYVLTEILDQIHSIVDFEKKISCDFMMPCFTELNYEISAKDIGNNKYKIVLSNKGVVLVRIIFFTSEHLVYPVNLQLLLCQDRSEKEYSLSKHLVNNLSWCSYYVGMISPGELAFLRRIEIHKIEISKLDNTDKFINEKSDYYEVLTNLVGEFECITYSMRRNYISLEKVANEVQKQFTNVSKFNKKAVVVGSTGALGSQISILLMYLGFEVIGISNNFNMKISELERIAETHNFKYKHLSIGNIDSYDLEKKLIKPLKEMDLFAYCASPFIERNFQNYNKDLYSNYFKVYVNQFEKYFSFFTDQMKLIVPSTLLLNQDENDIENYSAEIIRSYREYIKAKEEQEERAIDISKLKNLQLFMPRLPAFQSRHHSLIDFPGKENSSSINPYLNYFANWLSKTRQN